MNLLPTASQEGTPKAHRCGFVALVGRSNVGKSTLLNRLVGEKLAIVSPVPQTTRHRILGVRNVTNGQIIYLDAPGFHKPHTRLNRAMLRAAVDCLEEADAIICVVDAAAGFGPGDRYMFERLREVHTPILLALSKIDLLSRARLLPLIDKVRTLGSFQEIIPVSALKGTQCDVLERAVLQLLPAHPPLYPADYLTDQPERLLAAEMIREQVLLQTRQEIPHVVAVVVERFAELKGGSVRVQATIYVERDSQKAIVVGRGGQRLKAIGSKAREQITRHLGRPTSVFLWVKVHPNWREDARVLERWRRAGMASG